MKKTFKRKGSSSPAQVEPGLADLAGKMQEQLANLEKKIDILIGRSSERPSGEKHFSKSFQRFDNPRRNDSGRQDNSFRERTFTQVVCADCKQECEVPFKPSAGRPVYCKECFSKRKEEGGSFKVKYDNRPEEMEFTQSKKKKPFHARRKKHS